MIPEFDTPGKHLLVCQLMKRFSISFHLGHTESWGPGIPGLLTKCFSKDGSAENNYGPINPVPNSNYKFLKELFQEIFEVFPDSYVHLGGDEVEFDCW